MSVVRTIIRLVGLAGLLAILVVSLVGTGKPLDAGAAAPRTVGTTLDGGQLDLASFRGHFVVVNVWATWCGPCLHEMPDFVEQAKVWQPKGVQFVGLAADSPKDDIPVVAAKMGLNYPVMPIDAKTANAWNAKAFPSTYIVDPNGKVAWSVAGGITAKDLDQALVEVMQHAGGVPAQSSVTTKP